MMWQPADVFQCVNSRCKSKVVVLQSPRSSTGDQDPRCVCGHPLQRAPYGPQEPLRVWTF
jgi:hypothetical protein